MIGIENILIRVTLSRRHCWALYRVRVRNTSGYSDIMMTAQTAELS